MTCSNPHCQYEFCWICRKDWKLHNTETGGKLPESCTMSERSFEIGYPK